MILDFRNVMIKAKRFLLKWKKEDITCKLVSERAPPSLLFFRFTIKVRFHRTNSFPFKPILSCNTWIAHLKIKWYFFKAFQVIKKKKFTYLQLIAFLCAMPKILLLRSIGKSQILRCRCWNKIHRILSFVITTNDRNVQRQTCCFGQKCLESTVWFCSNLEQKFKYQHLCDKIELQFSSKLPKTLEA